LSNGHSTEKLLIKVITDLSDFLPYLVLVGGWVPYIYAKYIWGNVKNLAVTTSDIDFGVIFIRHSKNKGTIASCVRKLGYGEHHESMDRPIPFVPVVKSKEGNEKADVEFIVDLKPSKYMKEKLIGKEIKINEIKHFNLLLESITKISIVGQLVQIPTESIFVFHKLLTFIQRENKEKLRKDLYYVYYMLRFCPRKDRLIENVKSLIKDKGEGESVVVNIQKYFSNHDSEGPIFIEQENGSDYFIDNIREDAYKKITQLLG